jgi:hypothetical protein
VLPVATGGRASGRRITGALTLANGVLYAHVVCGRRIGPESGAFVLHIPRQRAVRALSALIGTLIWTS